MALVSVICVCYNQGRFAAAAIESVMKQTHPETELVIVDDGSTDDSVEVITKTVSRYPQVRFFPLPGNGGYCKAFNFGLARTRGAFIIDLAADDVLLPQRIAKGLAAFAQRGALYGVHFSDAYWMTEDGRDLYRHSDRFPHDNIPQGDVYRDLIERYFICSPTMMFRRSVIDALNGYDESLGYEDFDFWIRSSRDFYYCYTPEVLVKKRIVRNAMSQKQFSIRSPQLRSTFRVCEKIMVLNRTSAEQRSLARRIRYEITLSARLLHFGLMLQYVRLLVKNKALRYAV